MNAAGGLTQLWGWLRSRRDSRSRLYGVGTGKSGTHSLALLFPGAGVAHEPEALRLLGMLRDAHEGALAPGCLRRFLRDRDRRLRLRVDVSQLNAWIIEPLLQLFPRARFVLTLRDPWSWLDSHYNHRLQHRSSRLWRWFCHFRFGPRAKAGPAAPPLARHGLYGVEPCLAYWAWHNRHVLGSVPAEQLLVVRTDQLGSRLDELARFAGWPRRELGTRGSHAFVAPRRFGLLEQLAPAQVDACIQAHCRQLLARFFPELSDTRHWLARRRASA